MPEQNERNNEKSEMRAMWIMTAVIVLITWTDGHEHADAPRLDAWSVAPN
jgi:hypothetical protein